MCSRILEDGDATCALALVKMHFSENDVKKCSISLRDLTADCSTECPLYDLYSKHIDNIHVELPNDPIVDYTPYRCHPSCIVQMDDTTIASCLKAYRELCDTLNTFKQCVEKLATYHRDDVLNMFATNLNERSYFRDMSMFKTALCETRDDLRHIGVPVSSYGTDDIVSIAMLPNLTVTTELMLRSLLFETIKIDIGIKKTCWYSKINDPCADPSCPVSDFLQSLYKLVISNEYYPTMHTDYDDKLKLCMIDDKFKCVECTTQFQRLNFPYIVLYMHELAEVRKNVACTLELKVESMRQQIEQYSKMKDGSKFKYDYMCRELEMIEKDLGNLTSVDHVRGQCVC